MYGYVTPTSLLWAMTHPDPTPWDEEYDAQIDRAGQMYREQAQALRDKDERERKWKQPTEGTI